MISARTQARAAVRAQRRLLARLPLLVGTDAPTVLGLAYGYGVHQDETGLAQRTFSTIFPSTCPAEMRC